MESTWLLDNSEKAGIIGILAFNIIGLLQEWVVVGRQYRSVVAERDALRKSLDDANARDRAKLERVEAMIEAAKPRRQ